MEAFSVAVVEGYTDAPPPVITPPRSAFDTVIATALLTGGDPDRGLRYVVEGLAGSPAPVDDPAWPELLQCLNAHPFVKALRTRTYGYSGGPEALDVALGLGGSAGAPPVRRDWLIEHSTVCRALRRRTFRLAQEIDLAAVRHPGAPVVGFGTGHARELQFSTAIRDGRAAAWLLEPNRRACNAAAAASRGLPAIATTGTLLDVLSGAVRTSGCSLVYLPALAEHLPEEPLFEVLGAMVPWLRTGGQVVLPFYTALPDARFLRHVADWRPNVLQAADVLQAAGELDGVDARVEHDEAHGLAYLYLLRSAAGVRRAFVMG
jgi:hypothetical protein